MKVRSGFVSNSSSTSFVICLENVDEAGINLIKSILKWTPYERWDEDKDDYILQDTDKYIYMKVDWSVNLNEIINFEFLRNLGCTIESEC